MLVLVYKLINGLSCFLPDQGKAKKEGLCFWRLGQQKHDKPVFD